MLIRLGCRLQLNLPQTTPIVALLNVHHSRYGDVVRADDLVSSPSEPLEGYRDGFGNWCTRILAPAGEFVLSTDGVFRDGGQPDPVAPAARQLAVQDLPAETLVYLLGSRYCDTDLFQRTPGACSARVRPAGRAFRRSAISFTETWSSATIMPMPRARHPNPSPKAMASAGISHIWRSRCAAA